MSYDLGSIEHPSKLFQMVLKGMWSPTVYDDVKQLIYQRLGEDKFFITPNGRSALYSLLSAIEVGPAKNKLLVPSYTCVVVVNAIRAAGFDVVYYDVVLDDPVSQVQNIEKYVADNVCAIIVQYVFGFRYNIVKNIKEKFPNIIVIEDCCHEFGAPYSSEEKIIGTAGDASFFSFDHTKYITALGGGLLVIPKTSLIRADVEQYITFQRQSFFSELKLVFQYYTLFQLKLKRKGSFTARIIFALFVRAFRFKPTMQLHELSGEFRCSHQHNLGSVRLAILWDQLKRIDSIKAHRKESIRRWVSEYGPEIKFGSDDSLRILISKHKIHEAHKHYQGEWFSSPVHPISDKNLKEFGYEIGSCLNAERLCKTYVNLPTGYIHNDTNI